MPLPSGGALLQAWRHTSHAHGTLLVLPDGCIDLIGVQAPGQAPQWKFSPLMDTAQRVASTAGQCFAGYRFRPGAQIKADALLAAVQDVELDDPATILGLLDSAVSVDHRVNEALEALASERDLRLTLHQLGVSERSLERLIHKKTARTPMYWKRLARLRQAARALCHPEMPLADLAMEHGFADQSHMNREFRRWLGMSPAQVRQRPAVLRLLNEPGFA